MEHRGLGARCAEHITEPPSSLWWGVAQDWASGVDQGRKIGTPEQEQIKKFTSTGDQGTKRTSPTATAAQGCSQTSVAGQFTSLVWGWGGH